VATTSRASRHQDNRLRHFSEHMRHLAFRHTVERSPRLDEPATASRGSVPSFATLISKQSANNRLNLLVFGYRSKIEGHSSTRCTTGGLVASNGSHINLGYLSHYCGVSPNAQPVPGAAEFQARAGWDDKCLICVVLDAAKQGMRATRRACFHGDGIASENSGC